MKIELIVDSQRNRSYQKGKLLGKGGFAICFELMFEGSKYAAKCISKATTKTAGQAQKLKDEIDIHKDLDHVNIVKFHNYFEDISNVYILLEICDNKSLLELHKRRNRITEPETRYLCKQIAGACEYLHAKNIIHRDLKLANVLLDSKNNAKVADFGLASRINTNGEKRNTKCGTPNYIAPEIIQKKGHSFEVDVWSLGCLIYTLLVGNPPFETSTLSGTYSKIVKNDYVIPNKFAQSTNNIIKKCLEHDMTLRPTMTELLGMEFFKEFIPTFLPKSILTTEPQFPENVHTNEILSTKIKSTDTVVKYATDLKKQIRQLLTTKAVIEDSEQSVFTLLEKSEDPKNAPIYWISKWIDYSDKYGFGYKFNNGGTGVLYNDGSKMLVTDTDDTYQYVDLDGYEVLVTGAVNFTGTQLRRVELLKLFKGYMDNNLVQSGHSSTINGGGAIGRYPFLTQYYRTKVAVAMCLSNGIIQINFIEDHIKLILCPIMNALTYLDAAGESRTFSMESLKRNGVTKDLQNRLKYAYKACEAILTIPPPTEKK